MSWHCVAGVCCGIRTDVTVLAIVQRYGENTIDAPREQVIWRLSTSKEVVELDRVIAFAVRFVQQQQRHAEDHGGLDLLHESL